jgi:quercetin dioxygenase-like cupin family protein
MQGATVVEQTALKQFTKDGLVPTRWSNAPHAVYGVHDHPYGKTLVVVEGGITFVVESTGRRVTMKPGDRLDLPPRTPHSAVVGPEGVVCLEGHLPR